MATSKARAPKHRVEPHPLAQRVGERIRHLRKEAKFSFDAFVGETELGRGTVSELERGLIVPSVAVLARIAAALELTIADLVLGDSLRERVFHATRGLSDKELRVVLADLERRTVKSTPK